MFNEQFNHIFTKEKLKYAFDDISKNTKGLDEISFKEFKSNLSKNIDKIGLMKNTGARIINFSYN